MKRSFRLLALALACVLTLVTPAFAAGTPSASGEMRGVWVSSVYNLDYPSSPTTDPDKLRQKPTRFWTTVSSGINAVFLQVRPSGDALYKSDLFPWGTNT